MPKLKTHKTAAKRFKISGKKNRRLRKLIRRHTGQDHFNSRESGKTGLHKRRDQILKTVDVKNIEKFIPYS